MRNKNMIDFGELDFAFTELHLRSFGTIDEKYTVFDL